VLVIEVVIDRLALDLALSNSIGDFNDDRWKGEVSSRDLNADADGFTTLELNNLTDADFVVDLITRGSSPVVKNIGLWCPL
jgi:hypothetical protein